jgi:hypothetical protein
MEKIKTFFRENRSFKFLAKLFLVGVLGIGVMTIINNPDAILPPLDEPPPSSPLNELQKEITTFESKINWKLEDYKIVEVSITTSAEAELISGTTKGNLLISLNNTLEQKTFKRCEAYLSSLRNDNPAELKTLLNTLLNVVASSSKINFYKTQIDKYNYYEKILPSEVIKFVSNPINYEDEVYTNFSKELNDMDGFEGKYKNHSKFTSIAENLKEKLDDFNFNHYNVSPKISIKKNNDKLKDQ